MATLKDLAKRMQKLDEKISEQANERAKFAAIAALKYLLEVTPVDTSKAMSNWQIGINIPVPGPSIPAYSPGMLGYTSAASYREALAVGTALLSQKKPGETIYISNVTEYIGELDRGSSRQFAGGFAAKAAVVARRAAREYKAT